MIDRRDVLKLGTASVLATQAATLAAKAAAGGVQIGRIVVFNDEFAAARSFASDAAQNGAAQFAISGELAPERRQALYKQLMKRPTVVVGLTTEDNAFQIKMLAGDAFHFEASRAELAHKTETGEQLVEWVIAPVSELGA